MAQNKRYQKRINFDEDNLDLFEYLESKGNASTYMRKLLREDFEQSQEKGSREDKILEILRRIESKLDQGGVKQEPMSETTNYVPSEDDIANLTNWGMDV